ncbi:DNA polymerase alpha catalytic subunit-like isoform X2 [Cajanus cajan]|nr:DNA polymerase alpha catalytic subunit-like isoform X2 [Cajanus cajan]
MMSLDRDVQESRISSTDFYKKLHDVVNDVKNEIAQLLVNLGVSNFSMTPVKRKDAFERSEIPTGENYSFNLQIKQILHIHPPKEATIPDLLCF